MVDIKYLKSKGISSGAYKEIFTKKKLDPLVEKLVKTIGGRVRDTRDANLKDYRTYWAIDLAHETPFAQITPTLVSSLLQRNLDPKQIMESLKVYGLAEADLFTNYTTAEGDKVYTVNAPVFYKFIIPLVRAYHTVRTARLYNQRDKSPLFKYRPNSETDVNRVQCEIITKMVDKTAQWYGWPEYLKQAISQQLKYGTMLAFPREEWHCERQIVFADGKEDKVVQKEGLRYVMPHPTRMGWDLHHPLPTINTDSGVEFAYHWELVRYGDVLDNRQYWNKDRITYGSNWMDTPIRRNYFAEVYPCTLKLPHLSAGENSREERAAIYSSQERDTAVFLTEFFWKLNPRQWGLGDYNYPVWHRFTVASDDTIIWAAPCAYNPIWFMGYDFDSQAAQQSSFSLECIPWQDHIGNLLTQMVLTAKQNLENVKFYDENMVSPKVMDSLKNIGEAKYRSTIWVPFNSLKIQRAGLSVEKAFLPTPHEYRPIVELQSMVPIALNLMERTLQITAQETGAAASHYQGNKEIQAIGEHSDNRINYTASSTDSGIDAWMKQAYEANIAYRDKKVTADVTSDIQNLEKIVSDIGFKIKDTGPKRVVVVGEKTSLNYNDFVRTNVGPDDPKEAQFAQVILQTMGVIAQKPEFVQAVGVNRIVKLLEQSAKFAGAPEDFDITSDGGGDQMAGIMAQLQPVLEQLQQSTLAAVTEKVAAPAAQAMAQQQQEIEALKQTIEKLEGIFAIAEANQQKLVVKQQEAEVNQQIKTAEFQAEQQRKQQAHEADMQRANEKAGIQTQVAAVAAQSQVEVLSTKTAAAVQTTEEQARTKIQTDRALAANKIDVSRATADAKIRQTEAATAANIEATEKITAAKIKAAKKQAAAKPKTATTGSSKK